MRDFARFRPILRGNIFGESQRSLFPFHQPHERTCGSTAIYSNPCRKGILHLQTSIPSQGFEPRPSAQQPSSLTSITDGQKITAKD
ncbi:hypothetical protein TNCV_2080401 [Trichonephila clavipes]|nr:hypothetical protein TNCV_2080401 [Trichonephila clavipes]